jgi:hypothetical protein
VQIRRYVQSEKCCCEMTTMVIAELTFAKRFAMDWHCCLGCRSCLIRGAWMQNEYDVKKNSEHL